jgi:hypothetical protein
MPSKSKSSRSFKGGFTRPDNIVTAQPRRPDSPLQSKEASPQLHNRAVRASPLNQNRMIPRRQSEPQQHRGGGLPRRQSEPPLGENRIAQAAVLEQREKRVAKVLQKIETHGAPGSSTKFQRNLKKIGIQTSSSGE